ncbi:Porin [Sphingomonas antarctica]|uniref:TorF family putative porin n=1 Tax=Sphingomonas antarctica TaxID=2040274 RepID=UPI0039EB7BEB
MRTFLGCCGSIIALAIATPAIAQDTTASAATGEKPVAAAEPAAPTSAFTINSTAAVVSDYRFRGLSQTDKDFALQGSLTVTHASGAYLSVWGSSIDDYVAAGGDQELDLIAGFKKTFGGTTVDVGALYYYYPGSSKFIANYNSDFLEPYLAISHTLGPVTAKVTANYAPKQKALAFIHTKDDNLYTALDLSATVVGFGVSGHLGHNWERSFLSAGRKYTDWGVGVSYTWKALTLGVNYVDTNLPKYFFVSTTGKDVAKGGVVASIGVSF